MRNFKKGFTLIELLVVVAIIGILASVVLASLNSARTKGSDAAIKADLSNARAQAELFYDSGQSYAGVCTSTGSNSIKPMIDNAAAKLKSGLTAAGDSVAFLYKADGSVAGSAVCHDSALAWAAIVSLKNTTNSSGWCVDSTGTAKESTGLVPTTNGNPKCN